MCEVDGVTHHSRAQGRMFLVEGGVLNIAFGYEECILNWATFGAQAFFFGTERPNFYFCMIVKTK